MIKTTATEPGTEQIQTVTAPSVILTRFNMTTDTLKI